MRAFPVLPPVRSTAGIASGGSTWTLANLPAEIATEYFAAIASNGGTISTTNQAKVTTLLTALQAAGIYRKLRALYLYHGNVLNAARLNTINPTTYPGAHAITWTGSPTLDANGGFTPAVGKYGMTDCQPDGAGLTDLFGAGQGFYSTSNASAGEYSMGVYSEFHLSPKEGSGAYNRCSGNNNNPAINQDLSGFHFVTREPNSSTVRAFRNGTNYGTNTTAFLLGYCNVHTQRIKVGGMIDGVTHYASTTPVKLSLITDGITAAEMVALNAAIQEYVS